MQNLTLKKMSGRKGPEPALTCEVEFEWPGRDTYVLTVDGHVLLGQTIITDRLIGDGGTWFNTGGQCKQKERYTVTLTVPLGPRAIQFVEDSRGGGDVRLTFALRYQVQEPISGDAGRSGQCGQIQIRSAICDAPIPRSEWLKRLAELGWQDTEVFEIIKGPLMGDEKLAEAMKLIDGATAAFRNGDYKGVLAKCRSGLESAAKYESPNNVKKGFEALLDRAFSDHPEKPKALNGWLKEFSEYCHVLGRHEDYPAIHVSQGEARFALTACLAFFSLLSIRLSGRETF